MAIQLQKAKRIQAKIKIAIGGASGSGKTLSALLLAYGLVQAEHPQWTAEQVWDHIAVIDAENRSSSLYVGKSVSGVTIGSFNAIYVEPPFEEQTLIDSLAMCEQAGIECAIIDSASAYWTDALETQGRIAERTKNAFSAWRPVKNDIQKMMNKILQCNMHIIANYRAKIEYTQETNESGKKVVKSLGMGIIAEGNTSYEYSTMLMLDADHVANAAKDRTGLFDGKYFVITPDTGKQLYQWMAEGEVAPPPAPVLQKAEAPVNEDPAMADRIAKALAVVDPLICAAAAADKEGTRAKVIEICGDANYKQIKDIEVLTKLYHAFNV